MADWLSDRMTMPMLTPEQVATTVLTMGLTFLIPIIRKPYAAAALRDAVRSAIRSRLRVVASACIGVLMSGP